MRAGPPVVVLDHADPGMADRIVGLQRAAYAAEARLIGFDRIHGRDLCAQHVPGAGPARRRAHDAEVVIPGVTAA